MSTEEKARPKTGPQQRPPWGPEKVCVSLLWLPRMARGPPGGQDSEEPPVPSCVDSHVQRHRPAQPAPTPGGCSTHGNPRWPMRKGRAGSAHPEAQLAAASGARKTAKGLISGHHASRRPSLSKEMTPAQYTTEHGFWADLHRLGSRPPCHQLYTEADRRTECAAGKEPKPSRWAGPYTPPHPAPASPAAIQVPLKFRT